MYILLNEYEEKSYNITCMRHALLNSPMTSSQRQEIENLLEDFITYKFFDQRISHNLFCKQQKRYASEPINTMINTLRDAAQLNTKLLDAAQSYHMFIAFAPSMGDKNTTLAQIYKPTDDQMKKLRNHFGSNKFTDQ